MIIVIRSLPTIGVRIRRHDIAVGTLVVQVLVLLAVGLDVSGVVDPGLARQFLAVVYLTFVPGLLTVLRLAPHRTVSATTVVYAVGVGLAIVMFLGGLISLAYPLVGVERPLDDVPLALSLAVVVVGLAVGLLGDDREGWNASPSTWFSPTPLALLLLPFASVLGTALLDFQGNNWLLLGVLVVVAALPALVAFRWVDERWCPLLVWTASLALIYHGGAIFGPFVGGHQSTAFAVAAGGWTPDISLLGNGALFASFVVLADSSTGVQWLVVNPFLMSFIPLVLYEACRRVTDAREAVIAASIFAFAFPFYTLYTGAGRMGTPVFFLALVALVAADRDLSPAAGSVLGLLFALGVTVTHYGTSYVVLFAFLIAGMVLALLRGYDRLRGEVRVPRGTGGSRARPDRQFDGGRPDTTRILSVTFVGFFAVAVIAWYLYTGDGAKFVSLVSHVNTQVESMLYGGEQLTGSAAGAATREYGSPSIVVSRYVYVAFGALMAVGLLALGVRRLRYQAVPVTDERLALGVGFLLMIAASALPGGDGFNIARIMMISFVFTVLFAPLGARVLLAPVGRLLAAVGEGEDRATARLRTVSVGSLAAVLFAFLLLNTGVVAEVVTHEYGPSNKASTERLLDSDDPELRLRATECIECNVEAHAWLMSNAAPEVQAYGDTLTWAQVDFYRGPLAERLGYAPNNGFYADLLDVRNGTAGGGYFLLLPHNFDTNGLSADRWYPMGGLRGTMTASDRLYDSGEAVVYRSYANASGNATTSGTPNVTGARNDASRDRAS